MFDVIWCGAVNSREFKRPRKVFGKLKTKKGLEKQYTEVNARTICRVDLKAHPQARLIP